MVYALTLASFSSRAMAIDSRCAGTRRLAASSIFSGPCMTSVSTSQSRSNASPSVVPTVTRPRLWASSASSSPASATAIRAAAMENWLARPTIDGSNTRSHGDGSNPTTSQPLACSKFVVSNSEIGRAPLRPARSPAANSSAPTPMLETTPNPVSTTLFMGFARPSRWVSDLPAGGLGGDLVHAVEVGHARQLGLLDDDAERLLQRGQDLDRPQRVGLVVLDEQAGVGDLVLLDLQDLADDLLDLDGALGGHGGHLVLLELGAAEGI